MRLLLDTHILIWLAEGSNELSTVSRQRIDRAGASGGIAVSAISFWEAAMLSQRGRISLESVELPGDLHPDPADRLIVATARVHGCRVATRDRRLLSYGAAGHVSVRAV